MCIMCTHPIPYTIKPSTKPNILTAYRRGCVAQIKEHAPGM